MQVKTLRLLIACSLLSWQPWAAADPTTASVIDERSDAQAIVVLFATWRAAVEAGDIDAYLSHLDADIRLLPPGMAPIVGTSAYGEFLKPVFKWSSYRITVDLEPQVDVIGDMAYAEYIYSINMTLKEGAEDVGALTPGVTRSRYFDVLRRDAQGKWRVWRHAWQVLDNSG